MIEPPLPLLSIVTIIDCPGCWLSHSFVFRYTQLSLGISSLTAGHSFPSMIACLISSSHLSGCFSFFCLISWLFNSLQNSNHNACCSWLGLYCCSSVGFPSVSRH